MHYTQGRKEGDWIIYSCPICDYERRFNVKTGEMKFKGAKSKIFHGGSYEPPGTIFIELN